MLLYKNSPPTGPTLQGGCENPMKYAYEAVYKQNDVNIRGGTL